MNPIQSNLPVAIPFGPTNLSIIDRDGRPWITSADLARALGYSLAGSVNKIFERNKREFTDDMTLNVNLTLKGFGNGDSAKPVRIFSARGCHLVAMFARTPDARAFRRWVLDVLEKLGTEKVHETSPVMGRFQIPDRDFKRMDFDMAQALVADLRQAVTSWLPPQRAQKIMPTLDHLNRCLTRGYTEMTECRDLLHFAKHYLDRWRKGPDEPNRRIRKTIRV